ncbi:MAG: TIM barrel protein, partial [Planctomycetes bacterium]|nr:TIM barrel protein [Planctomycetota bacterium]
METKISRRQFLTVAAAGATCGLTAQTLAGSWKTTLHKALIGKPDRKTMTQFREAGFEGLETQDWNVSPDQAASGRKIAESLGMRIHSVMRGWAKFNSKDKAVVEKDIASVETALRAAQAYGADAVLLVPCRIGGMAMPQPWEFDIDFDPKTGHVRRVVAGDNSPYQDYIAAHNHAVDTSRAALERLAPVAEKTGVIIAVENVWNNLWVKPAVFQNFVASFQCRWIQAYFDIGNHVKYAP